jgi:hypothetical protein
MAFSVNDFRQYLTGDGARPNLFEISMVIPSYAGSGATSQKLTFMCNTAQLPGSTIGVVNMQYFGREVKLAGNRTYADWSVQVINDEDFTIRNALETWHYYINGPEYNVRQPIAATVDGVPGAGYGVSATVTQYGKTGNILKQYDFVGMFPVDLAPIDLNWGSNDAVEEFGVTFAYQYWTSPDLVEPLPA